MGSSKNNFTKKQLSPILLNAFETPRLKIRPMYYELGFVDRSDVYGRQVVLDLLKKVLSLLPQNVGIVIWDCYRNRKTQGVLFEWMCEQVRLQNPNLNDEQVFLESKKYMSAQSKVGHDYCPPHLSGGAVDLTLFDVATGHELDMGTVFDDCTDRAHAKFFDQKPNLTIQENLFQKRRTLLRTAMETAGFTSYQYEWWHFDVGNVFWAKATGQQQLFGPLFGDLEWPTD